jgi:arylsulfatase
VDDDFAENHDVSAENRAKLIEMIAQWYVEAGKYNVLPIDGRGSQRVMDERPAIAVGRSSYTYYPHTQPVSASAGANVMNRPHSITADVEIPDEGAEGVIFSHGGSDGGYSLYMKDGKLHYVHNYVASEYFHVESAENVPAGSHQLRFEFEVTGPPDIHAGKGVPGRAQLYFDDKLVGQADFPYTTPLVFGVAGGALECGQDSGSPVTPEYKPPFEFTGTIDTVTVDVSGELIRDTEAEMRQIMARQ